MNPRQTFPRRRSDGSANVAAVFRVASYDTSDLDHAFREWHETLSHVDMSPDLASDPAVISTGDGFDIEFEIRPGSRLWRDWAVALVGAVRRRLGSEVFIGFTDLVAHPRDGQGK